MVKSTLLGENLAHNLSKLPKVDKSDQVASFVKQQERNAKVYKVEGLRYVEVWGKENAYSVSAGNPPRVEDGGGKEVMTPVLKARNPGRRVDREVIHVDHRATSGEKCTPNPGAKADAESPRREKKKSAKGGPARAETSPAKRPSRQTKTNARSPKKRTDMDTEEGSVDTEERDRQTRMDQRKQRRREKRDIVNPKKRKASPMDDDSEGSAQTKRKRSSKKTSRRQKVPAGLALMHGFSATNVGKSRLTIEATRSIGVFSRGKASSKANRICDLEAFFKKPKKSKRARSAVATSESEEEEERPTAAAAKKPCLKPTKAKISQKETSKEASSSSSSTSEHKVSHRPRAPSITWSIERESALLPSTDISVPEPVKAPKEPSVANPTESSRLASERRSSLGPYDSASQCVAVPRPDPPKIETFSKYFKPRPAESGQASESAREKSVVVPCPGFTPKVDRSPLHVKDSAHSTGRTHLALAELATGSAPISESREEVAELEDYGGTLQEDPIQSMDPGIRLDGTALSPTQKVALCDGSASASIDRRSLSPKFAGGRYPSSLIDDYYGDLTQGSAFQGPFDEHLGGEYTMQGISQHDELGNAYSPAGDLAQWECLEETWLEDEQEGITDGLYPGEGYQSLTARGEEYWQTDGDGGDPKRWASLLEDTGYEGMEFEVGTGSEVLEVEQYAYDSGDLLQEEEALANIHSPADSSQLGEDSQESLAGVCQFLAGRSALLGFNETGTTMSARVARGDQNKYSGVSRAELDVGRNLKDHWRPQRLY